MIGSPVDLWPYLDAAAWLIVGGFLVGSVMAAIRVSRKKAKWLTSEMGHVERVIYAVAFGIGQPELAAGWLVLKVGGTWRTWADTPGVFNGFLTGTGLNVLFGASAGLLPAAIVDGDAYRVVGLMAAPVATLAVVYAASRGPHWIRFVLNPGVGDDGEDVDR